jgi:hypothetical protein
VPRSNARRHRASLEVLASQSGECGSKPVSEHDVAVGPAAIVVLAGLFLLGFQPSIVEVCIEYGMSAGIYLLGSKQQVGDHCSADVPFGGKDRDRLNAVVKRPELICGDSADLRCRQENRACHIVAESLDAYFV